MLARPVGAFAAHIELTRKKDQYQISHDLSKPHSRLASIMSMMRQSSFWKYLWAARSRPGREEEGRQRTQSTVVSFRTLDISDRLY